MNHPSAENFSRLLLELLSIQTQDRLITEFVRAVNASKSGVTLRYIAKLEEAGEEDSEEITTGQSSFGWIAFTQDPAFQNPHLTTDLRAAARLLAVLLENRHLLHENRPDEQPAGHLVMGNDVLYNASEGVIIYDHALRYVFWNKFMEELTGYSAAEVLGRHAFDLFPTLRQSGSDHLLQRALDGETIHADDVPFFVERSGWNGWLNRYYAPQRNARGEIIGVVATVQDVTRYHRTVEALRESQERYELAVEGANDGIWDWDLKTGQVYYSRRWMEMIGCEADEQIPGRIEEWLNRIHPGDYWKFKADILAHQNGETTHFVNEHRILHKNGNYRWVLARATAVHDADNRASRIAGSLTDVTNQKMIEDRLRHDAMHDPLTHLPNRAYFIDQVRRAVERARRQSDYQAAVLYLDLDRFKLINESLGHGSGDLLLMAIARRLQGTIRPRDLIARFGGDEFAILLDDIVGVGDATRIAQRILEDLSLPFEIHQHEVYPGASIGIALITTSTIRAEDVLRDADTAMYRAKAGGGGRHQVFGTEMYAMNVALFELEAELRRAVERKQFQVYYQPIVSLNTGRITAVEALIRWHHPRRGLILPGEFIILAEETGLILPIGEWVLYTACRQAKEWRDAGFTDLCMAVNISPRQLHDEDLPQLVRKVLDETGLPADALQLEITEWAAMQNMSLTVRALNSLKDMGVSISIDDFGTSYSSLGYLKRFPVSTIKIDQSFVRDIMDDTENAAITKAIINMGNVLGLSVVAEGVEMEQQLAFLAPQNCDEVQGDLLGRPVPGEAITSLLQEGHTLLPDMESTYKRP